MRILLTGANGYIGKRLLPLLLEAGHEVYCCVRDPKRFNPTLTSKKLHLVEVDFLNPSGDCPDFDVAFYLIHSLSSNHKRFEELEKKAAHNFNEFVKNSGAQQIIYLSGLKPIGVSSQHLESRNSVEEYIKEGDIPVTILRAGIVVGSGSASFEIIRDLVEKLPFMITPKWLNSKCQPIAIRNVLHYLTSIIGQENTFDQTFDIGGHEVLTYKEMLLQFAEVRKLRRWIVTLPVLTPRLSSYWLYFVTSTSYFLAKNLVNSMKVDVVCRNLRLQELYPTQLLSYKDSVEKAFTKIAQNSVISSWKDAVNDQGEQVHSMDHIKVPAYGVFRDIKTKKVTSENRRRITDNIMSIGGQRGWYYANFLWKIRGWMDKVVGGVGLRRGRTHPDTLQIGDALDFWRVIAVSPNRLLLFAEMKLPGDAWLEFVIDENTVTQTATFRPVGLSGRLYWYSVLPFHFFIFEGMLSRICSSRPKQNH
ncbi:MAG: SDR family oxidoreductase [Schleiferiaceae bacterium]